MSTAAVSTSGTHPLKTTTTNAVSTSTTSSSEHTAMTTPLHDETDPLQTAAAGTVAASDSAAASSAAAVATPAKEEEKTKTNAKNKGMKHPNSKLVLGEYIAEGGFCTIYEVTTIQDLDTQEYLWGEPPAPSAVLSPSEAASGAKKGHRSRRTMSISNFTVGLGQKPHKRGQSTSALIIPQGNHLPPHMKSVEMTVVRSFQDVDFKAHDGFPSPADNGDAPAGGNTRRNGPRKSITAAPFRRSATAETGGVANSFLKRSSSKSKADPTSSGNGNTTDQTREKPQYVIKCLKNPVLQNKDVLDLALKDMTIEIQMLQRLRHPNIIGLRAHGTMVLDATEQHEHPLGAAAETRQQILQRINNKTGSTTAPTAYPFLILDRLGDTLEDKFRYWEAKNRQKSTLVGKLVTHRHHHKHTIYGRERWEAQCDMAAALSYLHRRGIIYRDIKPENVAFDRYTGTLKLLDFGLAKDLAPLKPDNQGLYLLTGLTGSARYMAPEVAREDVYNEKCDVYGLAIVMWQIMALETPFAKFNVNKMFKFVYDCPHVRPSLEEWRSKSSSMDEDDPPIQQLTENLEWFARLLSEMWSPLIEERPKMKDVHRILQQKLDQAVVEQTKATSMH